jgi:hypothetical protein
MLTNLSQLKAMILKCNNDRYELKFEANST